MYSDIVGEKRKQKQEKKENKQKQEDLYLNIDYSDVRREQRQHKQSSSSEENKIVKGLRKNSYISTLFKSGIY